MCGIFGYSGAANPESILLNGLRRLEYRGYDSWGVFFAESLNNSAEAIVNKGLGPIPTNEEYSEKYRFTNSGKGKDFVGIAHTRWATHGGVTLGNAHPHLATDKSFALAQNGIVENYQELKQMLVENNYKFISETDTEVIVRLIEHIQKTFKLDLFEATTKAFAELKGRNTIILCAPNLAEIIAIKHGSPLVIGKRDVDSKTEYIIGSDYLSLADLVNEIIEIPDFHSIHIKDGKLSLHKIDVDGNISNAELKFKQMEHMDIEIDKAGYADFMLKEIYEQPHSILNATSYSESDFAELITALKQAHTVYTVGCGIAYLAASQIAYYLRTIAGLNSIPLPGYELESHKELFNSQDLIIAVSQSGETADTLEAVEFMKAKGGKIVSLVNMVGSTLTRASDYSFLSRTGPEICVASTKAFTAQVAWGYLLAQTFKGEYNYAKKQLEATSSSIKELLDDKNLSTTLAELIKFIKDKDHAFVLGKGQNFAIALEGALKVKEITYKHFEGFTAGELKHGVIALIDNDTPVFAIVSEDSNKADMLSSVSEVKARGAKVIAIASESNELYDYWPPVNDGADLAAIVNVIPFQLFAYKLGKFLGNNVDRPRNLAKSVTVK